jgi:hypothetical protein
VYQNNKEKRRIKMGYFRILAAIPGFFLSSLFVMLLWDVIAPKLDMGTVDINYVTSMLITITLWIAVAPLAAVGKKK